MTFCFRPSILTLNKQMSYQQRIKVLTFFCLMMLTNTLFADEGFPGRAKYPDIPYISISDFHQGYINNQFVVVDARSQFEYKVIKVVGALNFPVNSDSFFKDINALAQTTDKTIVFYCNGRRCMKSFKAAKKSKLSNIKVFDAGVFDWSIKYPKLAELLNESPLDPSKIISKKKLKQHFLPLSEFEQSIAGSVLIDIRDKAQRRGNGLFLLADRSAPLDETRRLDRYIEKAIAENKPLLAYDDAGKQVRWLQYYLEKKGVNNYYFMEGGAKYYSFYDHESN